MVAGREGIPRGRVLDALSPGAIKGAVSDIYRRATGYDPEKTQAWNGERWVEYIPLDQLNARLTEDANEAQEQWVG